VSTASILIGCAALLLCCTRAKPPVPILGYHSIGAVADEYTVPLPVFEQQLDWLKAEGFATLSVRDLIEGAALSRHSVILTFDDGKEDAVRLVLPALRKRGMRASFFVITGLVGKPGYLGWDDVRTLAAAGMEIGSHTVDHPRLADLAGDRVREQLVESRRTLEHEIQRPIEVLAYPFNSMRASTARQARDAGYRAALAGIVHGDEGVFSLYRFTVTGQTSIEQFKAALAR
jgi:peptidoglycan/xylan/chitin deacetylase (PgdA/CDA1 family)